MVAKERITNSIVVIFLGAMTTGFIGGFAAHRALTEAQGQTLILKTKLGDYEQKANELIATKAKMNELEKTVELNNKRNSLADELASANTKITELENKNSTQLKQIEELRNSRDNLEQVDSTHISQDKSQTGNSSLKVINHDQEFSMKTGDIVAIGSASMIFTISNIRRTFGSATYSNTKKAISSSNVGIKQAVPIRLYEGCSVIPLKIISNADGESVKFIADCSM